LSNLFINRFILRELRIEFEYIYKYEMNYLPSRQMQDILN
jgi:hypothetical protein